MSYKLVTSELLGSYQYVEYVDDEGVTWNIPLDEGNADYQRYLVDTDGGLPLPKENA